MGLQDDGAVAIGNADDADGRRRKLRPLVISMGGERKEHILALFSHPSLADHFEQPVFSPGVPSRSLRSRVGFLRIAHQAGLIPDDEWKAVEAAQDKPEYKRNPERFFDCLKDVPVTPGRRGNEFDVKLHYSVEIWQKAKGVNRGRSVLACTLAHLLAMKRCVEEGLDFILEDNVRAPPMDCARRIWESIQASREKLKEDGGEECHLRYYGWLGSIPNVKWVLETHSKRLQFARSDDSSASIFPFPVSQDFELMPGDGDNVVDLPENDMANDVPIAGPASAHRKPGGTPIWGAYAYWISPEGYECLLDSLQKDVGALLWKGKRNRCYMVKPVDKVMPRQVMASLGRQCIHVTTHPSFFRAPMLTSKIHAQWDAEFCRSTSYQMDHIGLNWSDLWLTETEHSVVNHHRKTGNWLTIAELSDMNQETAND